MSYAGLAGVLPGLPAGFTDFALPIQEKNGLVWVADPVRELAVTFVGTKTDFSAYLEDSGNTYGRAYLSVMPRANWVQAEVAAGNAVAVSPAATSASPALRVLITADPYGLAWETGRNFGGDYAIVAAPPALVTAAEAAARAKKPRDLPGGPAAPAAAVSTLPKWVLPVVVGGGILLLGAIVIGASKKSYKMNSTRPGTGKCRPRPHHSMSCDCEKCEWARDCPCSECRYMRSELEAALDKIYGKKRKSKK